MFPFLMKLVKKISIRVLQSHTIRVNGVRHGQVDVGSIELQVDVGLMAAPAGGGGHWGWRLRTGPLRALWGGGSQPAGRVRALVPSKQETCTTLVEERLVQHSIAVQRTLFMNFCFPLNFSFNLWGWKWLWLKDYMKWWVEWVNHARLGNWGKLSLV